MQEHDSRAKAKQNAEFITPPKLRKFLSKKVKGSNLSVIEPAVGSGQLLFDFEEKIAEITGYEVNSDCGETLKNNFGEKINFINSDFITADITGNFDVAISNHPFSLKANEEQKKYILSDKFLGKFYEKKITGVLDFVFILKAFNCAKEGHFLCFPGIGYRSGEKKFRRYLVENGLVKEYGLINNCKFEHTSISILYLYLSKEKSDEPVKSFLLDLETDEKIESEITEWEEDCNFVIPSREIIPDKVSPVELEKNARKDIERGLVKQIQISQAVWQIDEKVRILPSIEEWKNDLKTLITIT
ncbi:hypothetical protein FACS1894105_04350 [Clostridia bacterium]|nr:hypothetical protein FACS1894105_04350 [Clostridia bacterium]